jgi:hypothetical protein
MMSLNKCPRSLCFSHDGSELAVGTAFELRIISTTLADWAGNYRRYSLTPPSKGKQPDQGPTSQAHQESWNGQKLHSQALSFSPDRNQLMVATQYGPEEGTIYMWLFDFGAGGGRPTLDTCRSSQKIRMVGPCVVRKNYPPRGFATNVYQISSDPGLTAIPCFHKLGQTTYIVGMASAHHKGPKLRTIMPPPPRLKGSEEIIGIERSLERVRTAVPIPGEGPRFILVNEDNDVYLVQQSDSARAWGAERIPIRLPKRPSRGEGEGWRVAVAPLGASNITLFYIDHGCGHLVRYDASRSPREQSETIPLDAFKPRVVDIAEETT